MTRYILILIVLYVNKGFAQDEYKTAQGFYNLSEFEMASGIYLLENKTFFFFASFGNVDLKTYGTYKIQDGLLTLQPDKELMQEFYIYGRTNRVQSDNITITYRKPIEKRAERIMINDIKFPEFSSEKKFVSISMGHSSEFLKIEYSTYLNRKEYISVQLADSIDELLIFHNYYAHMVRDFCNKNSFTIRNKVLTSNNQVSRKKEISKEVMNELILFIDNKRNDNTFNLGGEAYNKLIIEQ